MGLSNAPARGWATAAAALLAAVFLISTPLEARRDRDGGRNNPPPPVPAPTKNTAAPTSKATASPTAADTKSAAGSTSSTKTSTATSKNETKEQAKKKADDDDDDDNKSDAKSKSTTAAAAAKKNDAQKAAEKDKEPDPEPPATLADLFSRLVSPKAAVAAAPAPKRIEATAAPAGPRPAPVWGQTKVVPARGATAGRAVTGAGLGAAVAIPITLNPPPERIVLASSLSSEQLAIAADRGFTLAATSKSATPGTAGLVGLVPSARLSSIAEAERDLRSAIPGVKFFQNLIYRPFREQSGGEDEAARQTSGPYDTPDCPNNRCYGQRLIGWDATRLGSCAAGVRIGVIDTAHDGDHPAFANRNIAVGKVDLNTTPISSPNWHGTGVLAILAGNPGSTTPGLLPNARYVLVDVFFGDASGQPMSDTYSLLLALRLMDRLGVNVVNLSLSGPADKAIEAEIAAMVAKGIVFVAAAGNEGLGAPPSYPAAYKGVIAVTAVNHAGLGYRHASQGPHIDLAAPGVGIWTAAPGRKEAYRTGTSFAAPYVTATVAVMQRFARGWSKDRLLARLEYTDLGTPGRDEVFGRGLVKAPQSCTPDANVATKQPGGTGTFKTSVKASGGQGATLMRVAGPESEN